MDSIDGGMFGMLSILGRHERAPDREFEVVFSPFGKFMAIDGRPSSATRPSSTPPSASSCSGT